LEQSQSHWVVAVVGLTALLLVSAVDVVEAGALLLGMGHRGVMVLLVLVAGVVAEVVLVVMVLLAMEVLE
jgi:hypothetical protein